MRKLIILAGVIACLNITAKAQNDWFLKNMMTLNWQIATPVNSNYLTKTSFAGGRFEFRHFVKKNLSVGADIDWNSFEQYIAPTVYEKPDGSQAMYTDMVRQVYNLPLAANVHYYFDGGAKVKPYIGIGLGGQYSEQSAYYNIFVSESNNWGFVVRPEVGALFRLGNYAGLHANVGYNYATNKNEDFNINSLKHVYYSIGMWWNVF